LPTNLQNFTQEVKIFSASVALPMVLYKYVYDMI